MVDLPVGHGCTLKIGTKFSAAVPAAGVRGSAVYTTSTGYSSVHSSSTKFSSTGIQPTGMPKG